MNPLEVVRASIKEAANEMQIEAGACFDWVGGTDGKPRAANWAGAVLWKHRDGSNDFSYRRLKTILGIDDFWSYRFTIGFDQGRVLSVLDPKTFQEVGKDDISLQGVRLAKEAGIKRR